MAAETNEVKNCSECGTALPFSPVEGRPCPVCLLKIGLESEADLSGVALTQASGPLPSVPDIESLQPLFPQFEFIRLIGHGGMGAVYQVRQRSLDRTVALKIVLPSAERAERFAERFEREAKSLARLSHRNIVTVHDFGSVDMPAGDKELGGQESLGQTAVSTIYYFVMEYIEGVNLRDLIRRKDLTPAETLRIVPEVCDALQYAHDRGIVHRDIKPENILVDESGEVKIADFGLAKLTGDADRSPLTATYQAMGTPHYMAPEQMERPAEVDHRADIFALGVTLYELLTGELPLGRFAPPSRKVRVDVRLDEIVLRALEREPELRYQKISDVKTDVQSLSQISTDPVPPTQSDHDRSDDPAAIATARDTAFLFGGTLAAFAVKHAMFDDVRTWMPLFAILSLAVIAVLRWLRTLSVSKAGLVLNGLLAGLVGLIVAMPCLVEHIPHWIDLGQPGADETKMLQLWSVFFAVWVLFERFMIDATPHRSATLKLVGDHASQSFSDRAARIWLLWPKTLRVIGSVLIGVAILACMLGFVSFSGKWHRTSFEHVFGKPEPWLSLSVHKTGHKWELSIVNQSVLLLVVAIVLTQIDNWISKVEKRTVFSMWWLGVAISFCLSISPVVSLLGLILNRQGSLTPEEAHVTQAAIHLMGFTLVAVLSLFGFSVFQVYRQHRERTSDGGNSGSAVRQKASSPESA